MSHWSGAYRPDQRRGGPAEETKMRKYKPKRAEDAVQEELLEKLRLDQMVEARVLAYGEQMNPSPKSEQAGI